MSPATLRNRSSFSSSSFSSPSLLRRCVALAAAALLLSACGGGDGDDAPAAPQPARVETLLSRAQGMSSLAFDGDTAYLSLYTGIGAGSPSTVLRSGSGALQAGSTWSEVELGDCAMPPMGGEYAFARAPVLVAAAGGLHLLNESPMEEGERTLCLLDKTAQRFVPNDQGLRACFGDFCYTLWATQLKQVGSRLFINAGGGDNVFASDDQGRSWRVLTGSFDSIACYHAAFHVVGQRLLVGGECPLDDAYLHAYGLTADGGQLASPTPQPVELPELENRNIQFIESAPGSQRVFAGVEGGLLRSDDGGRSFKFVIRDESRENARYVYVKRLLQPRGKPGVVVAAGFDKTSGRPFLSWSPDGGERWTDLSALLPGYKSGADRLATQVSSLVEDAQGRIFLTVNEDEGLKGHLLRLELGSAP